MHTPSIYYTYRADILIFKEKYLNNNRAQDQKANPVCTLYKPEGSILKGQIRSVTSDALFAWRVLNSREHICNITRTNPFPFHSATKLTQSGRQDW